LSFSFCFRSPFTLNYQHLLATSSLWIGSRPSGIYWMAWRICGKANPRNARNHTWSKCRAHLAL